VLVPPGPSPLTDCPDRHPVRDQERLRLRRVVVRQRHAGAVGGHGARVGRGEGENEVVRLQRVARELGVAGAQVRLAHERHSETVLEPAAATEAHFRSSHGWPQRPNCAPGTARRRRTRLFHVLVASEAQNSTWWNLRTSNLSLRGLCRTKFFAPTSRSPVDAAPPAPMAWLPVGAEGAEGPWRKRFGRPRARAGAAAGGGCRWLARACAGCGAGSDAGLTRARVFIVPGNRVAAAG
jgi:hypothetical protein